MATPITTKEFFEWTAKTWTECSERAWSEEGEGIYSTPTTESSIERDD
jgi:hypothetical protein